MAANAKIETQATKLNNATAKFSMCTSTLQSVMERSEKEQEGYMRVKQQRDACNQASLENDAKHALELKKKDAQHASEKEQMQKKLDRKLQEMADKHVLEMKQIKADRAGEIKQEQDKTKQQSDRADAAEKEKEQLEEKNGLIMEIGLFFMGKYEGARGAHDQALDKLQKAELQCQKKVKDIEATHKEKLDGLSRQLDTCEADKETLSSVVA